MTNQSTLFFLHGLGLGAAAGDLLAEHLGDSVRVVGIDLPGFGAAAGPAGIEETVGWVERRIGEHGSTRWGLIGHSMGGKIAAIVAARALSGESGLFGLRGIVLLAASPTTPEPMDEQQRTRMLGWATNEHISAEHAAEFIDANAAARFAGPVRRSAVALAQDSSPAAWREWLLRGSREDWQPHVPVSALPALVLAGSEDGDDLGPAAQQRLNVPRYLGAHFDVIAGSGHFLMLEQPEEVARRIRSFWTERADRAPEVPAATARVIASPRTSARTRGILAQRALADRPERPRNVLDDDQLATLRVLAEHVVPQGEPAIDLAARVDAQLGGAGDGWRNADLPDDITAYRLALDALHSWSVKSTDHREAALLGIAQHAWDGPTLTAAQMAAWFEDARVDLVRQWLAHPATMARIGFDGFANGGDGARQQGFTQLSAGQREAWEPTTETR